MATPKNKKGRTGRKAGKIVRKSPNTAHPVITADMRIAEVVTLLPGAERLLAEYGLHCANCMFGGVDTIGAGCQTHGFSDADIEQLIADLNELLCSAPVRPMTIAVTLPAAQALQKILREEGQPDAVLSVEADARGNFCMEFRDEPGPDDRVFTHPKAPTVRVVASPAALLRIGGSAIDFREGRFKLDLPAHAASPCACSGGSCACADTNSAPKPQRNL